MLLEGERACLSQLLEVQVDEGEDELADQVALGELVGGLFELLRLDESSQVLDVHLSVVDLSWAGCLS